MPKWCMIVKKLKKNHLPKLSLPVKEMCPSTLETTSPSAQGAIENGVSVPTGRVAVSDTDPEKFGERRTKAKQIKTAVLQNQ